MDMTTHPGALSAATGNRMRYLLVFALSLGLTASATPVSAKPSGDKKSQPVVATQKTGDKELDDVMAALKQRFADRQISSVRATPIKGIYEAVFPPKQVVYTDAKGEYLLVGELVDLKSKTSLTEARVRELSRTDFAKLPLDLAVKVVRGDGTRKVAVFTDPDCPYCRKLEQDTIKFLDNVTIYNFLMPLPFHTDAPRKSHLVWCSADPAAAWNNWVFDSKLPEAKSKPDCEAPLAKVEALAQQIGVSATPSMVFESGDVVSGALAKDAFEKQLVAKKP